MRTSILRRMGSLRNIFRSQGIGQSVVEFAFILPLLLILVFGITEMGRMLMRANVLTQAAREGARALAIGGDSTTVVDRVIGILDAAGIDNTENPAVVFTGPDADNMMQVTVTSDFTVIPGYLLPFSGTFTLTGVSSMRLEL